MIDDSTAARMPVPNAAPHTPPLAERSSRPAMAVVSPAFFNPSTTRYMPSENITNCHGASRIPVREVGRGHVCTPVTHAQLECRLLLEKDKEIATLGDQDITHYT